MDNYLVIRFSGPMQGWGSETLESYRSSEVFPTISGILGLLMACLGVERKQAPASSLATELDIHIRADNISNLGEISHFYSNKLRDYHTVRNARVSPSGTKSHDGIQTWREYIQDQEYTILINQVDKGTEVLSDLEQALKYPVYTPFLGRKCCPVVKPLFSGYVAADSMRTAFLSIEPRVGLVLSEQKFRGARLDVVRDKPFLSGPRTFASREIYVGLVT